MISELQVNLVYKEVPGQPELQIPVSKEGKSVDNVLVKSEPSCFPRSRTEWCSQCQVFRKLQFLHKLAIPPKHPPLFYLFFFFGDRVSLWSPGFLELAM